LVDQSLRADAGSDQVSIAERKQKNLLGDQR